MSKKKYLSLAAILFFCALSTNSAAQVVASDMVNSASQNLISFTNPSNGAFSSPADGFQKYQRLVSPSIPFSVLDDSLVIFPGDSLGIIKDGNNDVFFGTTDTENPDNSGPVNATWSFDVSGATGLVLSIDMGAMGDFESSDTFEWTYSIDGGPVLTAFASSVDEAGAVTYTLEGGAMFPLNDPMLVQGTILTDDLASLSTPLVGTGSTLTLTLTASTNGGTEAFAFQNIIVSDAVELPPFGVCGDPATFIHDVQGAGLASPLDGMSGVVLEGVVVGDFENTATELSGFFVQEEDSDADGDTMTSEGIFVFNGGFGPGVGAGNVVRVQGTVDEFFNLTRLTNVTNLIVCPGNPPATAASVSPPVTSLDVWETVEGMLVTIPQTLYVSGNFNQGRFGEVDLSVDAPLDNPTNVAAPGAPALAVLDLNNRSRIQLDDGSNVQNPLPLPPYIGTGNTLRTGDTTAAGLTAVLSFSFGAYELHPVGSVNFTRVNTRLDPPSVGGAVRVASFNVLNYFTTLDDAGPVCGPLSNQGCRGADNFLEFNQQRDKLVAAITKLDAHVVGVIEIENHFSDVPIADLVDGLNLATGPGTYDYIPTGAIGIDVIRVGLIYQPASVSPVNPFAVLDSSIDPLFIDTENRPVLAQSFSENTSGEVFTVAVNHLKSKGSDCDDIGDPDVDDGQGNCNVTRTTAAQALVDWLGTDPTGSDSDNFLIIGDLNAYAQEDPVTTIEFASYVDLVEAFVGTGVADGAYSFNFSSESGALDHALSSPGMTANVTGAAIWHINADEPRALDYNNFNQPALFNADEFRSSDHDPVLVGLFDDSDDDGVLDVVDVCPGTVIPESVPTRRLGVNRWALVDGDFEFDTIIKGNGKGPKRSYTTEDTAGCSCEQIIEAQGLGQGHTKFGCSIGAMDNWVELVTP